jgi:hypothetical protein
MRRFAASVPSGAAAECRDIEARIVEMQLTHPQPLTASAAGTPTRSRMPHAQNLDTAIVTLPLPAGVVQPMRLCGIGASDADIGSARRHASGPRERVTEGAGAVAARPRRSHVHDTG